MAYNPIHTTTFTAIPTDTAFNTAADQPMYDGWLASTVGSVKVTAALGLTNSGGGAAVVGNSTIYGAYSLVNGRVTIPVPNTSVSHSVMFRSGKTDNGPIQSGVGVFIYSGLTQLYSYSLNAGTYSNQNSFATWTAAGIGGTLPSFIRVSIQDIASTTNISLSVELLGSDGTTVLATYSTTVTTSPTLYGVSGYVSVGAFNNNVNITTAKIEEYTVGGPIVAGTIADTVINAATTPAIYFQGPAKTTAQTTISGQSGGASALQYAWKIRPFGSGLYTTAATNAVAAYTYTGLTPGTRYERYVTVSDASATAPADTPITSFWTASETVYFLGDSTTYGLGSSGGGPATSWPIQLQQNLTGSGYQIQALNAGSSGSSLVGLVGGIVTGTGPASVFTTQFQGYITTYGIDKLVAQAGANDARNDVVGISSHGAVATTSVATSAAGYQTALVNLKYACAAAGIRFAMDYPFFVPADAPSPFYPSGWDQPDPYILAYCAAIDTVQNGTNAAKRVSGPVTGPNSSYASYKAYWTANGGNVHPAAAYYTQYGTVNLPIDWKAAFTSNGMAVGTAPVASVTVTPSSVYLPGGATQQFTATAAPVNASQSVVWTTTAGTITVGGLLTAPSANGLLQTVTVTATSAVDGTKSATATVTVPTGVPTLASLIGFASLNGVVTVGVESLSQAMS